MHKPADPKEVGRLYDPAVLGSYVIPSSTLTSRLGDIDEFLAVEDWGLDNNGHPLPTITGLFFTKWTNHLHIAWGIGR
jgi:hypothetical protein